ncbi:helix-turn-helix domain-containing protein [Corynebacterium glyciniphilum]|uniref:helix-turn-helix domain-containing protein n=1 Tax=Corynebacterium glyciniphilum TaxID=1404244 RepID=UPI00264D4653|nr:helix-turn-helix transcriptional regulator [Corynebacterium glyciniphilum]MDN6707343.1 helix-turn-helix domain-containing protein [Corynebacterium glyciniphilum]MDN6707417.1 helix-turn-helix domain-containing protein [Corynebacterium glyciniphilum]
MNYMEQIATRLTQARQARGITQAHIRDRLNESLGSHLHITAISKVESGNRPLSINEAHAWCEAVGLKLSELIAHLDDGKPLVTVPTVIHQSGRRYVLDGGAA